MHPSNKLAYMPTGDPSGSALPLYGYKINTNGTLTALAGFPLSAVATIIRFTPNGKFAYTVHFATSAVEEYSVNTTTGALTSIGSVATGSNSSNIAITPKGTFAYTSNEGSNDVSGFSINPTTGVLTTLSGSPFATGTSGPLSVVISPNGKFLFVYGSDGSTAVFKINVATGALALVAGSPFSGTPGDGYNTIDPTGRFYYTAPISSAGVGAYTVNEKTGALTQVSGSPFTAGSCPFGVTADPSGNYLYVTNLCTGQDPVYVFSIDQTTGALTAVLTEGLVGQAGGGLVSFTTSSAPVKYTPTFAYITNSGNNSITEYNITGGGLTQLKGSPITDTNGPQASVATPDDEFFYTGNTNGSISEYSIGKTGALKKLTGSPITGLTNPVALAARIVDTVSCGPYNWVYAADPTANVLDVYNFDPTTGALTPSDTGQGTGGNGPDAIAVDPFGAFTLLVNTGSDDFYIGQPCVGFLSSVGTGTSPVAMLIDPSNQFVYVANSGDGTVSGYALTLASPYLTPLSGSPWTVGTTPSALVTDPWGSYLYVANSGSDTISAFTIDPLSGALTAISGTFPTAGSPSALAVSNNGNLLYVTDKDIGELQQFTINADGTLTSAGGGGVGTAPTSVTTIGTYK